MRRKALLPTLCYARGRLSVRKADGPSLSSWGSGVLVGMNGHLGSPSTVFGVREGRVVLTVRFAECGFAKLASSAGARKPAVGAEKIAEIVALTLHASPRVTRAGRVGGWLSGAVSVPQQCGRSGTPAVSNRAGSRRSSCPTTQVRGSFEGLGVAVVGALQQAGGDVAEEPLDRVGRDGVQLQSGCLSSRALRIGCWSVP